MDIYDILAILGTLAWLPTLVESVKRLFIKPKLSIISSEQLGVSYTNLGPVLNLDFAFSAEKKELLIKKIALNLIHQSMETHSFDWEWLEEQLLQIQSPEGTMPFAKSQKAIAIKVLIDTLVEKRIVFLEKTFKDNYKKLFEETNKIHSNICENNQGTEDIIKTPQYKDLLDHFKHSFIWKIGNYSADIKVYISNQNQPIEHNVRFQLTSFDVKKLEQNIDMCKKYFENYYVIKDTQYKENWEWVYPNKL